MEMVISTGGIITTIYDEAIDLAPIGPQRIVRASHVEPDDHGRWFAEIIGGPTLGPFACRSEAISAEVDWLTARLGAFAFLTSVPCHLHHPFPSTEVIRNEPTSARS